MVFYIVIRIFLRGIVDTGTREHGIRCKHSCLYTTNTLNNWKGRTFIFYTTPQKVGPLGRCKGISGQALGLPPQTVPNYCMTFSMDISHTSTWPRRQIPIRYGIYFITSISQVCIFSNIYIHIQIWFQWFYVSISIRSFSLASHKHTKLNTAWARPRHLFVTLALYYATMACSVFVASRWMQNWAVPWAPRFHRGRDVEWWFPCWTVLGVNNMVPYQSWW